jgi:hypothetical protein
MPKKYKSKRKKSSRRKSKRKTIRSGLVKTFEDDKVIKCQALTVSGHPCSRNSIVKLDLTRGKKLFGYTVIPKKNCCFFCLQHTAVLTGVALYEIGWLFAEKDLGWDEYVTLHPEYLEQKIREMRVTNND